jgi:hypothetical protein
MLLLCLKTFQVFSIWGLVSLPHSIHNQGYGFGGIPDDVGAELRESGKD